jgi:hypothetical protein
MEEMKFFKLIKAILWAFFGVRKREGMEADIKAHPAQIILVALFAAMVFIGLLIAGVKTALHVLT